MYFKYILPIFKPPWLILNISSSQWTYSGTTRRDTMSSPQPTLMMWSMSVSSWRSITLSTWSSIDKASRTINWETLPQNERAQTMTTNCEIITKWHDVFLMWDPAKYDNITDTRLPWEEVWTPDIVLYNAAGDGEQGREMRTLIQVRVISALWDRKGD